MFCGGKEKKKNVSVLKDRRQWPLALLVEVRFREGKESYGK
jgi:hypothetical protein